MKSASVPLLAIAALLPTMLLPPMTASADNAQPFTLIPIPQEEHGYNSFESKVILTRESLDAFIREIDAGATGWNNRADFDKALDGAEIDFEKHALVMVRVTEATAATGVRIAEAAVTDRKLALVIEREEAGGFGIAVMAYHCFALKVDKEAVDTVTVHVGGNEPLVLRIAAVEE